MQSKDDDKPVMRDDDNKSATSSYTPPQVTAARRVTPTLSLWRLTAVNPQEPPFHFSNVPSAMVVAAQDMEHARRIAVNEPGGAVWIDSDLVRVEEMKPETPMVVSRDFGP